MLYLVFKKKIDKAISSEALKDEIDALIVAFNRNAESNINILENRTQAVKELIKRLDEKIATAHLKEQSEQKRKKLLQPADLMDGSAGKKKAAAKKTTLKRGPPAATKANENILSLLAKKDEIDFAQLDTTQKVRFLKSQNKSDKEIAQRLNISQSEVKLMANLARYQEGARK